MKKIKFLAMMIAALTFCMGFTACGDDDDDEPANPLVGTWVGTFDHDGGVLWRWPGCDYNDIHKRW